MPILQATIEDIPALEALLNRSYRGEEAKKGWTNEADLIEGDLRTNTDDLNKLIHAPEAIFLKYINDGNIIEGCVFLQKIENRLYLGMLSVSPLIQAKGVGKQLMNEAEDYARDKNCSSVFMKVISLRHELVAWYERKGYHKTGETEPFPAKDSFGKARQPLEFVIMEKMIL